MTPDVRKVSLLFRASRDGWDVDAFHRYCDNKGKSVTVFRSSKDYLAAGYTSLAWSSVRSRKEDKEAFVVSLTNEMHVFKPKAPQFALWHYRGFGPNFDPAIGVSGKMMNGINNGFCATVGDKNDMAQYCIPRDINGCSVLTGDNAKGEVREGMFTCTEIEVFLIE